MASFKNKRVTVLGLGLNGGGVANARFFSQAGAKEVIVTDIKERKELTSSIEALEGYRHITFVLGQHRSEDFTHADLIVINPGIPSHNEYVRLAREHHIPVEMDASLFFQLCQRPILGVTGTKGKTTTTALLSHILETAGKHVVRVGIGRIPVLDRLAELRPDSVVVFELSSWRLSSLLAIKKSPHIALITNIFPDHLNYYKDEAEYIQDKKNIFLSQGKDDWLVYNADDTRVRSMAAETLSTRLGFTGGPALPEAVVFVEEGMLRVKQTGKIADIVPLANVPLFGAHNAANIAGAAAGAFAFGVKRRAVGDGLRSFAGVPHRLELVREKDNVKFYNDTTATIPEAAIAALSSFAEPIVLIAGGNDKGLQFEEFARVIVERARKVIFLPGEATERIVKALHTYAPEKISDILLQSVGSMEEAVERAAAEAQAGNIVLLSPGATSFGLFANEFDRGERFRAAVKKL